MGHSNDYQGCCLYNQQPEKRVNVSVHLSNGSVIFLGSMNESTYTVLKDTAFDSYHHNSLTVTGSHMTTTVRPSDVVAVNKSNI